jgi:hypothetical protein
MIEKNNHSIMLPYTDWLLVGAALHSLHVNLKMALEDEEKLALCMEVLPSYISITELMQKAAEIGDFIADSLDVNVPRRA